MTEEQLKALQEKVGKDAAEAIKRELASYEATVKRLAQEAVAQGGGITKEQFEEFQKKSNEALEAVKAIAEKQGTTLAEVSSKLNTTEMATKSISDVLREDKEELRKIYSAGSGQKTYMVMINAKGQPVMKSVDLTSTIKTGPEATIDGISGGVSAITQALDAATLLRVGSGAAINNQYRNTPWIFDLCNTVNASFNLPFVMWFDEQPKNGGSVTTAEGVSKAISQYLYQLNSAQYKKEATLVGFTEEFNMDFSQLESNIMNVARLDVINRVNSAILPNIKAAATAYNSGDTFKGGVAVPNVNDFDAIAALAAQVDNATFGARANSAIMSTNKKYRMGITKDTQGGYLNAPEVLSGVSFVGNPSMAADDLLVGDLKQYNIILRGGMIVRVGYNGTDFAENRYSTVLEQFYFDYISTIRKAAIVKGPDFATVKTAISA
ncbi:MAG: phage major capsid protein [Bacteroidota bacterium]